MDNKPCTCGGDNPNCFKCFGTGMVPDRPRVKQASTGSAFGSALHCGNCGIRRRKGVSHLCMPMFSLGIERHEKPVRGPAPERLPMGSVVGQFGRPAPRCPICGSTVLKNMNRHLSKVHAMLVDLPSNPRPAKRFGHDGRPVAVVEGRGYPCSMCHVRAETPLVLAAHKLKAHRVRPGRQQLPTSAPAQHGGTGISGPLVNSPSRESLDATHRWGGSFRDRGQFGSHVGYDDMDDESSP